MASSTDSNTQVPHVNIPPPSKRADDKAKLEPEEIQSAMPQMMEFVSRHFTQQCVYTIVNLGVPDVIGADTLSISEIIDRLGCPVNEDLLLRQMRFLAEHDIFLESAASRKGRENNVQEEEDVNNDNDGEEEYAFALGTLGKLLQTNVPNQPSMACAFQHNLGKPFWLAWSKLFDCTQDNDKTGTSKISFVEANGQMVFPYFQEHPESFTPFNRFMNVFSMGASEEIVQGYDWSVWNGKRVCDVGGGYGGVMSAVKAAYPEISATICLDLPEVIDMARDNPPVGVELVPGDMFDSQTIPPCDVIFMKHILHDWNDEDCGRILGSAHKALPMGGKLLLIEGILPPPGVVTPISKSHKKLDMMMALIGGRERTEAQWNTLLNAHGWKVDSISPPLGGPNSVFVSCSKV